MSLPSTDRQLISDPPDISMELQNLLRQIPAGVVTSFGDLAEALGDLSAARWVAKELQELDPAEFPIHRVVRRSGKIVGTPSLSADERVLRLRKEGIRLVDQAVDLTSVGWRKFVGSSPLSALRELQGRMVLQVTFPPLESIPERIAGVDVSYPSEREGVAAYTIVETATGKLLHQEVATDEVRFPYIPGYLSFRELPLYGRLLSQVRRSGRLEGWLLVDGNGILHPRRAGIATMLGWAQSVCTVGISKRLLCGKVADRSASPAEIWSEDGVLLGYCLNRGSKRSTLYVSPGAGVDAAGALQLTQAVLRGHRLPEPLYHADRLSREAGRRRQ
jgi:deoxyribonuclease V